MGTAMIDPLSDARVALEQTAGYYPAVAPFDPAQGYPESPIATTRGGADNPAYAGVRQALHRLGMDPAHFGGRDWNPLGELIRPGETVLLKPNLIREDRLNRPTEWQQIITHGAIVRAVLDYVYIALGGRGRVIIADGPQTDSDFELICQRTRLAEVAALYTALGLPVEVLDLRRDRWYMRGEVIERRETLPGDPAGYVEVDLGENSAFATYGLNGRYYGADYDVAETARFHSGGRHAYILCRSPMQADCVINLPKLKTHKKTGVTLSLKNLVGINGYRNCLPHHTLGTPAEGGDEFNTSSGGHQLQGRGISVFKRLLVAAGGSGGAWARWAKRLGRGVFGDTARVVRSGNWHGNDTAWRMVLDLNRAFFHFDASGQPRSQPRRYLTIVDGIVAGEGDGPVQAEARPAGLVAAGFNPLAVDTACALVMGFDPDRLPLLREGWRPSVLPLARFDPEAVRCASGVAGWTGDLGDLARGPALDFRAHFGWRGQIERRAEAASAAR